MEGKKIAIFIVGGTLLAIILIFLGFQWYFQMNPTQ
ncbi:hypothetical protein HNQ44_002911 [Planomicrobium koreense]|jgi:hypothetical protein|uniref:Uncharacterized protein n=1 Tax=Planococcus koreensis TaxID=112331 RepID=A0A7W8CTR5_9BACL|nr:hypothetical protein [Planococcus koreensis]